MLKIDGSFVRDILKDPRAESMVQAIAQLARSMKLITVAEYVESDEIRLRVATLGVDYGQGFAIARPVSMAETVAELPMYAARVAYGRELDGLLQRQRERRARWTRTDVAELQCEHRRRRGRHGRGTATIRRADRRHPRCWRSELHPATWVRTRTRSSGCETVLENPSSSASASSGGPATRRLPLRCQESAWSCCT